MHMIVTFNGANSMTLHVKKYQLKITWWVDAIESTGYDLWCLTLHAHSKKLVWIHFINEGVHRIRP